MFFLDKWESNRSFFNAGHLKILALITMLISHIAQTGLLTELGYWEYYYPFMIIGRIAFPIFCFFIVQGVVLTSNLKKYLLRLFIFALISEIPFDLAFYGGISKQGQNVIFTLFLGALCISFIKIIDEKSSYKLINAIVCIIIVSIFMDLADFLKTDYSSKGIRAIVLLFLAYDSRLFTVFAIVQGFYFEANLLGVVYLSIIFILLYNGKKGNVNKWLFYIFYPGHLLVIYLLMKFVNV